METSVRSRSFPADSPSLPRDDNRRAPFMRPKLMLQHARKTVDQTVRPPTSSLSAMSSGGTEG